MHHSRYIVTALLLTACRPDTNDAAVDTTTEWKVGPTGAGALRIGMSLSELAPHLAARVDSAAIGDGCNYVFVDGAPDSVLFMVEGRRLVRIDVLGGATTTLEGAQVGDTEAHILQLYPTTSRTPHKYTDGFYLIVIPGAPADTMHRYVFETDGHQVTMYRAGIYPPVEYVERCG
jgi:hypothetical protein